MKASKAAVSPILRAPVHIEVADKDADANKSLIDMTVAEVVGNVVRRIGEDHNILGFANEIRHAVEKFPQGDLRMRCGILRKASKPIYGNIRTQKNMLSIASSLIGDVTQAKPDHHTDQASATTRSSVAPNSSAAPKKRPVRSAATKSTATPKAPQPAAEKPSVTASKAPVAKPTTKVANKTEATTKQRASVTKRRASIKKALVTVDVDALKSSAKNEPKGSSAIVEKVASPKAVTRRTATAHMSMLGVSPRRSLSATGAKSIAASKRDAQKNAAKKGAKKK